MRSTLVLAAEFAGHASSVRFERSYHRCCLEFDRTGHSRTGKRDLAGVYRRGAQPTISPALLITFRRSRYKADPGGVSVLMSVIVPFRSLGRHTLSLHT
jgi:hypothetical protein